MSFKSAYDTKIFIIGMMGAGKSSVGMILSRLIGLPFIDTDELIGVDKYFDSHSINEFRLEEINQINQTVKKEGSCVISIGGGAVLSKKNRDILSQYPCFFLRASIDILIDRNNAQNTYRPLLEFSKDGKIERKAFSALYNERESHYLDLAHFIIDTDNLDILNTAMSINNTISNHEIIS